MKEEPLARKGSCRPVARSVGSSALASHIIPCNDVRATPLVDVSADAVFVHDCAMSANGAHTSLDNKFVERWAMLTASWFSPSTVRGEQLPGTSRGYQATKAQMANGDNCVLV